MCPHLGGHIGTAPASWDNEGFGRRGFRGSLTQPRHLLSYASRFVLPLTRKAGFRLAGLYREGVEPSGSLPRFQIIRSSSSPVLLTLLTFHTRARLTFAPRICVVLTSSARASTRRSVPRMLPGESKISVVFQTDAARSHMGTRSRHARSTMEHF